MEVIGKELLLHVHALSRTTGTALRRVAPRVLVLLEYQYHQQPAWLVVFVVVVMTIGALAHSLGSLVRSTDRCHASEPAEFAAEIRETALTTARLSTTVSGLASPAEDSSNPETLTRDLLSLCVSGAFTPWLLPSLHAC